MRALAPSYDRRDKQAFLDSPDILNVRYQASKYITENML